MGHYLSSCQSQPLNSPSPSRDGGSKTSLRLQQSFKILKKDTEDEIIYLDDENICSETIPNFLNDTDYPKFWERLLQKDEPAYQTSQNSKVTIKRPIVLIQTIEDDYNSPEFFSLKSELSQNLSQQKISSFQIIKKSDCEKKSSPTKILELQRQDVLCNKKQFKKIKPPSIAYSQMIRINQDQNLSKSIDLLSPQISQSFQMVVFHLGEVASAHRKRRYASQKNFYTLEKSQNIALVQDNEDYCGELFTSYQNENKMNNFTSTNQLNFNQLQQSVLFYFFFIMGAGQCCNQNPLNNVQKGEFAIEGQISRIFTEVTDEPIALLANSSPTQPFSITLNIKNEDYLDQMYQLCKVEENGQFSQMLIQQSQSNNQRERQSRGSIISIQSKQKYFNSSQKSIHTQEPTQSITKHIATSNQTQADSPTRQVDTPNKTLTSDNINIAVSEKHIIMPSQKNVVIQFQNEIHQSSNSISPERLSSKKKQSKKVRFTTVPLKKTIPQQSPIKNILKKKLNPDVQFFEL